MFLVPTPTRVVSHNPSRLRSHGRRWILGFLPLLCGLVASPATHAALDANSASALMTKYDTLTEQLSHNNYQRPLYLESSESSNGLKGDIYAVVEFPFAAVDAALNGPAHWCEAMILHINNRQCQVSQAGGNTGVLTLSVVRKYDQPLAQAFRLPFVYSKEPSTSGYFAARLSADSGPLGTSNHQILLEAIPLPGKRSFLHFAYSYDSNFIAQAAMSAYLATFGSSKVGFTVVAMDAIPSDSNAEFTRETKAEPNYIRGMRGLMERNAMRYYLAIDAYLANVTTPSTEQQLDKRLNSWFTQAERYPKQLHEIDRAIYLRLKHEDYSVMHSNP